MVEEYQENYRTGFISLFRSIKNHWIFKDDKYFKWWVLMLLETNYKDNKIVLGYDIHEIKRGQCANSLRTWSNLFSCSTKTVKKYFKLLEKDKMIYTETIGKGKHSTTLVNINNYSDYQTPQETQQALNGNARETQGKRKRDTTNKDNKVNKDNNKENFDADAIESIKNKLNYYTEKIGGNEYQSWREMVYMKYKLKNGSLSKLIEMFTADFLILQHEEPETITDFQTHFVNWLNVQQRLNKINDYTRTKNAGAV